MCQEESKLHQQAINTIRTLSIDAINQAGSGHPGMPMGAAPAAYVLWTRHMKINPANPEWIDRDRFVLSAGHGSMLLYSLLHLFGYDLPLEALRRFRQWGSIAPGHPEHGVTPGVDATTGPLGQGLGMAVGMAIAEAHLAAAYNRAGFSIIDHHTYVLCGDGDLMEGVSMEAATLAGHLRLGKLIVLYDSNDITLDGDLQLSSSDNIQERFRSNGWHVELVGDGNDLDAIDAAISMARSDPRPSLIEIKTVIGYGSPNKSGKSGEHGSHGVPLGKGETLLTKEAYGWPTDKEFHVPEEVRERFATLKKQGEQAEKVWRTHYAEYRERCPELAAKLEAALDLTLPKGWADDLTCYSPSQPPLSTRTALGSALNATAKRVSFLIGGSADLESSTKTKMLGAGRLCAHDYAGRNISFGVREFAMGTALNGILLHKGLKAFGGTFLVFSDYLRPAIRLAALMRLPAIYVFTHDSIAVGEDGPTHQPIEQLAALRSIPGLTVFRPADANEASQAWSYAVENETGPCALVLTRQAIPILPGTRERARAGLLRGAYVLAGSECGDIQAQLIATGSEVQLALEAQRMLEEEHILTRVISMPSWELFNAQPPAYRDSVLLPSVPVRLSIEMGSTQGWREYVGDHGAAIGIDRFGASAPAEVLLREYGFTADHIVRRVKDLLMKKSS
jgi:transketolase